MKNIHDLNTKWWFRLLKVIYVLFYALAVLFVFVAAWGEKTHNLYDLYAGYNTYENWRDGFYYMFWGLIITFLTLEAVRRIFYYVAIEKKFYE